MPSTLAADRLEFALAELRHAITNIEAAQTPGAAARDDLDDCLLAALRKAQTILAEAQDAADKQGLRRLAIF